MFKNLNTVKQGTVGLSSAIFTFCKNSWTVSIPLNDIQDYDLIVDLGDGPKTVQIKTTKFKENSNYVVQLKSVRPNKTKNVIKTFDNIKVDYLYILCTNGDIYFIPRKEINVKNSLSLNNTWDKYKI